MSDKKVIFFYYPLAIYYNHGISLLSSLLSARGVGVKVIPLHQTTDVKGMIKKDKPDYVGFGFVSKHDYKQAHPFVHRAKQTGVPVMVGGAYVAKGGYVDPRIYDYICRGEAEILADFILDGDTTVFDRPYQHKDLDDLPMPDYSQVHGYEFHRNIPFLLGLKEIPYSVSRGCPFRCSFCATNFQKPGVRIKKNFRGDWDILWKHYNPDLLYISDDLLPYYDDEFCAALEGNRYPFQAAIRADIEPDKLMFLIRNGLSVTWFGVESGDETYRNEVLKKRLTDSQLYRTVAILQENNVRYLPFYICGTPWETTEISNKTMGVARGIGGWPTIWEYENIGGRVFDIPRESLQACADKMGVSLECVLDGLNNPDDNIIANEHGFLAYRVVADGIYAVQSFGDGPYWYEEKLPELCRMFRRKKWYGPGMNSIHDHLVQKYGLSYYGHMIGKEVV